MTNDWERLGRLLVARRVGLGFTRRAAFARHHGLSHTRTVDDIENARRTNYEPATIAQVEQLYRWTPGSIQSVLAGGDPTELHSDAADLLRVSPEQKRAGSDAPGDDADIQLVMDSDLPEDEKHRIVRELLEERAEERQRRVARARRYIDLYQRAQGE